MTSALDQKGLDDLPRDDTGRITSSYEPSALEIEVARSAIRREFGNNGTDGYYIRILKAIHAARSAVIPAEIARVVEGRMASDPQAAAAAPKTELELLREEVTNFKSWGIIEIAVRNPNVRDYMAHWEARAENAEAELATLRARVEELERERDEARTWAYQQRLKKFRSGCACHISDDERLVRACNFHREFVTRAEAAEARLSEATRLAVEALEPFAEAVRHADEVAAAMGFARSFDEYEVAWPFPFKVLRRARAALAHFTSTKEPKL